MKRLLLGALLVVGCASQKEAQQKPPDAEQPPEKSKLSEAKEVGRMAAGLPPKAPPCPPPTREENVVDTLHGVEVPDPYRWLEAEKAPEVQQWMAAQDKCARAALATMPGREALAARFKELYYVDSVSAPVRRKDRFFYVRTHADREKAIVYWRDGEKGVEKVLLDPNKWSEEGTISLGRWVPSWDGKKVVYAQKPNAADEATLYVLDVESGAVSPGDVIPGAKYASPDWLPDNSGFLYEWLPTDPTIPIAERPGYTELRLHKLGTDPKADPVLHPRTGDPKTFLEGSLSRDGKYLFVYVIRGWSENDVYLRRMDDPKGAYTLLVQGKDAQYGVEAWKDFFYVITDEGAARQRVFKVSAKKPDRKFWKEIVPEDKEATLEAINIVGGHLALTYLRSAASELKLATLAGKPVRGVQLPGIGAASNLVGLQDSDDAYFSFSSFTTPRQVYKTSVTKGGAELWAKVELPIDPSPYTVTQARYPSKDGTQVSMFLVHRKDVKKDGSNAVLLYGYGGFNISLTPSFKGSIYPWLEAGGIYAVPNLRGGGEYGKAWHDAGMREHKQNVFDDFIAAAEWLVMQGYSKPERIAINGGSNGGLLVGAAMVQRPDLFGAVVCAVPLLDMVRYHLFGSGKTWIPEYGSAEVPADFKFIHAYSPYQHVKKGTRYPPLLMMSADHDDRVDPMHARKFVAAVQRAKEENVALLRIEMNAGHGGADQVRRSIDYSADMFAFLFQRLGLQHAPWKGTAAQ